MLRRVGLVLVVLLLVAAGVGGALTFLRDDGGVRPGVLRLGIVQPSTLDPARAVTVDEQLLAEQLFDTLTVWEPSSGAVLPGLAESWTVSQEGLAWDLVLRDGLTFSDGSPLTASDVEATLERIAPADSGSSVQDLLEPLLDVTAVDDRTVSIDLKTPMSDLLSVLANPSFGIVPGALAGTGDFDGLFVGSGPFVLQERSGDGLLLDAVGGRDVGLTEIEVRYFEDTSAAYEAFVDGDLDWSEVPVARVQEAAARYGREHFRTYAAELFYAFNLRNPKWADRRLREAVVKAVDREAIVEEVYDGTVRPMTGIVGAGVPGAVPDACGSVCARDVDAAKALVAEVVAAGGTVPEVAVDFDGDKTQTAVAEQLKSDLESVGFTVSLRPRPLEDYERFAVSGEQDLFRLGWIAPYPSGGAYLHSLFASTSPNNLTGFALSSVDELLRQARAAVEGEDRRALYAQAEQAILSELPLVPLAQFLVHSVATDRVRGLELNVMGVFDASTVSVVE